MGTAAKEKIIVALDAPDWASAKHLADPLLGTGCLFKIGLQLFAAEGPDVVRQFNDLGARIFLDLKFHDIPNTAAEAIRSIKRLGVEMTTIHLAGGPSMVQAAVEAAGNDLLVLGVTVLTSMDDAALRATGVAATPSEQVVALARMGAAVGLRGLVASPREITPLREALGSEMAIVTPGIRPRGADHGDQRRVASPREAVEAGATHLVIGRPVTGASDPLAALEAIAAEIEPALP